jgi:ATP-dependent exoDNAse (exonuclease V) beta subunit
VIDSLIPLAVLNYIHKALAEIKEEQGVMLNAEFNKIINTSIKNEPAPFIYERLGEKFNYYFIDEMQDTSVLQWQNLIPLIDHALSTENEEGNRGQLMVVGDAKQSIYRWRGGKPSQFIDLSKNVETENSNPFFVHKKVEHLTTNYRSQSAVVKFNNGFFTHISRFLVNQDYRELFLKDSEQHYTEADSGYVQVAFVDKNEEGTDKALIYPQKVLETIIQLDPTYQKNEICVLVRTKKQGMAIADYLSKNGIDIISSETLILDRNSKVRFIIDLLHVIQNPTNDQIKLSVLYFLYDNKSNKGPIHEFHQSLLGLTSQKFLNKLKSYGFDYSKYAQLPFYEGITYIISAFQLTESSDASLQYFLDIVFEYQQKKKSSVSGFLDYWELKKDKLSIVAPESRDAVRIMTIHKAKGLEFPVVIFPYDLEIYRQQKPKIWFTPLPFGPIETALVSYSTSLETTGVLGKKLYDDRQYELEFDNFNLLYVTFTRAVEQLYVLTDKKPMPKKKTGIKSSTDLLRDCLQEIGLWSEKKDCYEFGSSKRVAISEPEQKKTKKQQAFISSMWQDRKISIVANSAMHWDTRLGEAISYGNLIHELLSKIYTEDDIDNVLSQYVFKGLVNEKEQKALKERLNSIVTHERLSPFYSQNCKVLTERELFTNDRNIVIPDRLIFQDNRVTIIDYKTGSPDEKHLYQLEKYAIALKDLGYKVDQKILVYINPEIIVQEV